MSSEEIREVYNSVIQNDLENFKIAIHSINKPLNQIYINKSEKCTILHFLSSLVFVKISNELKYSFSDLFVNLIVKNPCTNDLLKSNFWHTKIAAMNNKYEMIKYLFYIFEIYFVKIKKISEQDKSENLSCPSMGPKNMSLSISAANDILILDPNSPSEKNTTDSDYQKIRSLSTKHELIF